MTRILVVEDELVIRTELRRLLACKGYEVCESATVGEAREHGPAGFDLVITDLRLPGASGTDLIADAETTPVLVMTSFATVKSAVDAMKLGAADYISKPFDPDELLLLVERLIDGARFERRSRALEQDVERSWEVEGMVAESASMRAVLDRVARAAPTDATILVLGESGTGKELVARAIHAKSLRERAPFVAVNCAAIPDGLIESELFGHEKGAFTGATTRTLGLVEAAHGGTLFLDEIGELPPAAQARLLRMLQESEVRRVGSQKPRRVDVRVIAATHRNLPQLVQLQEFREDLFFRLRVVDIRIPPLRERREDLPALARRLLDRACAKVSRPTMSFADDAIAAIEAHDWPGNVRELENALERAVILSATARIDAEALGIEPLLPPEAAAATSSTDDLGAEASLEDYFCWFVRKHEAQLSETEIARRLGISRKTLWERRQRFGLLRSK